MLEVILLIIVTYLALVLLLEAVVGKFQPDMAGVVTLHLDTKDRFVERKLYGFEHDNTLYVASNHWFRSWYHAVLANPELQVERAGALNTYTAVPIQGDELVEVKRAYGQGFLLRLACGFAPQRFIRLDPR